MVVQAMIEDVGAVIVVGEAGVEEQEALVVDLTSTITIISSHKLTGTILHTWPCNKCIANFSIYKMRNYSVLSYSFLQRVYFPTRQLMYGYLRAVVHGRSGVPTRRTRD